jgi:hypothetical protein
MSQEEEDAELARWEIHDAIDGRRWLGEVASREGEDLRSGLGHVVVHFARALEMWPWTTNALALPQQVTDPRGLLARNPAPPPQMQIAVQSMEGPAMNFSPPFKLPFMPPWTITSVGGCRVSAYPKALRRIFVEIILATEQGCAKALRDHERALPHKD